MSPNILTLIGQMISFVLFVLFCMKYVWPPLTEALEVRRKEIAESLMKAEEARNAVVKANDEAEVLLSQARQSSDQLRRDAKARADDIVNAAQKQATIEAQKIMDANKRDMTALAETLRAELRQEVSDLVVNSMQKISSDLFDKEAQGKFLKSAIGTSKPKATKS